MSSPPAQLHSRLYSGLYRSSLDRLHRHTFRFAGARRALVHCRQYVSCELCNTVPEMFRAVYSFFFFLFSFFCAVHSVLQVFNKIHPSAQLAVKRQMNLAELNSFEFLESDTSGSSSGSHASALSPKPFQFWESENKGGSSDSRASAPSYRVPSKELLPISFRELDW